MVRKSNIVQLPSILRNMFAALKRPGASACQLSPPRDSANEPVCDKYGELWGGSRNNITTAPLRRVGFSIYAEWDMFVHCTDVMMTISSQKGHQDKFGVLTVLG